MTQQTGQPRPGLPTGIPPEQLATLTPWQRRGHVVQTRLKETFALVPLRNLFIPEVALCTLSYSLPYTAQFMVLSTLSQTYQTEYHWTVMEAALVFLALGIGSASSSFISGRLLNRQFRKVQRAVEQQAQLSPTPPSNPSKGLRHWPRGYDPATFPIERARLYVYPFAISLNIVPILIYGWLVEAHVHPAAPIPFLFLAGLGVGTVSNIVNTLLLDYLPGKGAGATASLNLVRCLVGAGG